MTQDTTQNSPTKKRKSQSRGRSNSLPGHVVGYLKKWLMSPEHINHPYPSESEKARMVADTGIDIKRLNNWFVNNRIRYWKPRYEAMQKKLLEQNKKKLSHCKTEAPKPMVTSPEGPPKPSSRTEALSTTFVGKDITNMFLNTPQAPKLSESSVHRIPLMGTTAVKNDVSATVSDDESSTSSFDRSPYTSTIRTVPPSKTTFKIDRCRKRQRTEFEGKSANLNDAATVEISPRFKYDASNDAEQWKLACSNANSTCNGLDDSDLPSLDEAVQLFGYSLFSIN